MAHEIGLILKWNENGELIGVGGRLNGAKGTVPKDAVELVRKLLSKDVESSIELAKFTRALFTKEAKS
jgi:hypothetical protein